MYLLARLYSTDAQARAAAAAILEAGYGSDHVAMLGSTPPQAASTDESAPEGAEVAAVTPAHSADDIARMREMLGYRADFYLSRLRDGRGLVVAAPPWFASREAELILDAHEPLEISHEPPPAPFVPTSQQAAPLSDFLGLKVLSDGPVLASYNTKQDAFKLSNKLGIRLLSKSDTPLSSMFGLSTRSSRGESSSSSFGMSVQTRKATPLSSMFGLPVLTKRQRFLS
ncbi:MAG: hypothetical protein AB8B57_10950 [Congregibacter sp.]